MLENDEKISWIDRVRTEEVLQKVRGERNIIFAGKRRKANWIVHILRRNCLLKHVSDGKVERRIKVTGRRGRRSKQLLDDVREKRVCCKLKEETSARTLWRIHFGRGLWTSSTTDCAIQATLLRRSVKFYVRINTRTCVKYLMKV